MHLVLANVGDDNGLFAGYACHCINNLTHIDVALSRMNLRIDDLFGFDCEAFLLEIAPIPGLALNLLCEPAEHVGGIGKDS